MNKPKFEERLEALSKQWFNESPFFNEFVMRFSCREKEDIGTIGLGLTEDKRNLNIYYNQEFVDSLNDSDFEGIVVHEIMHVVALTQERLGGRYPRLWNMATDITNNYEILKSSIGGRKLTLPPNGIFVSSLDALSPDGYKAKIIAEDIYDFLLKHLDSQVSEALNRNNFDNHKELESLETSKNDIELIQQIAKEIVNSARARKYGNISSNLAERIDNLLKPKIRFIDNFIYYAQLINFRGNKEKRNTFTKLNRREFDELPGKFKRTPKINIGADTSGSISEQNLKEFFTEIEHFSRQYEINLIQFDCEVKSEQKYTPGLWKKIQIQGRGGTDIACFYNYLDKKKSDETLNVILTDGEFNWNIDWKGKKNNTLFIFCNNYVHSDKTIMSITL